MTDQPTPMKDKLKDLGLSYASASHGVQSVKAMEVASQTGESLKFTPKHMRTGVDLTKAEMHGLSSLLIDKGVFTLEEYAEYIRLAVNHELASEQAKYQAIFR